MCYALLRSCFVYSAFFPLTGGRSEGLDAFVFLFKIRFDIFPPDWGMLRKSRCVQIFLQKVPLVRCLEGSVMRDWFCSDKVPHAACPMELFPLSSAGEDENTVLF